VVDVDDEIAGRQARGLGQEVGGSALLAGPRQPVAEDVGLGDDREVAGDEAVLDRDDRPLRLAGLGAARRGPVLGQLGFAQAVVAQHDAQPLGRAFRP